MYPWTAGEEITSTKLKLTGQGIAVAVAGENINASASAPKAVFFDTDDNGEVKIASSAASATARFHGFVTDGQNVLSTETVYVRTSGVIGGFAGLTAGADYYLSTSGAVSTTAGTVPVSIGIAISTTEIFVLPTQRIAHGQGVRTSAEGTGDEVITHNLGVIPKFLKITAMGLGDEFTMSVGTATGTGDESCTFYKSEAAGSDVPGQNSTRIIELDDGSGSTGIESFATVTGWTATSITLNFSSNTGDCYYQYEIYG